VVKQTTQHPRLFCQERTVLSKAFLYSAFTLILSSCGYHFTPNVADGERLSVSIPYIQGDPEASFNNEITNALSKSGRFDCFQSGGDLMLQIVILSDGNGTVGYRFDRDTVTGARRQNVLAVENRRSIAAQVTLYDAHSGEVLFGPTPISASIDYDYADPGSPQDLNTTTSAGSISTIRYSYGQLNTVEGGHDDASPNIYRRLSQKIVESITNKIFLE